MKLLLCDSEFFNWTVSWHGDRPIFSPCFRDTALVWLPACIFLLTVVIEHFNIVGAQIKDRKSIPWNLFNSIRLSIVSLLFVTKFCESISYIYMIFPYNSSSSYKEGVSIDHEVAINELEGTIVISSLLAPIIQSSSYLSLSIIYFKQRLVGIHTSGLIWCYLLVALVCNLLDVYSFLAPINQVLDNNVELVVAYIHCPLLVLLFIYECRGDVPFLKQDPTDTRPEPPELYAGFLSSITFSWFSDFLLFGYRRHIRLVDLWKTLVRDRSCHLVPLFRDKWTKCKASTQTATYQSSSGKAQPVNSIAKVIFKMLWTKFLLSFILKLIHDSLWYTTPPLLKLILTFMSLPSEPLWHGILYACLLLVLSTVQSIVMANYVYQVKLIGLQIKTMTIGAIYRKGLLLSGSSRLQSTSGEIVNLMAVDSERFQEVMLFINLLWSSPYQASLAIYMLYRELGWSVFAGITCMLLIVPLNIYIGNKIKASQTKVMKTKDERIKQMNELLSGIKVIKLYAWEDSFVAKLFGFRNRELKFLNRILNLDAVLSFLWQCSPTVVALVSFAVYVNIDDANVLTAEKAFVSLSLFNLLRYPLANLPNLISLIILASVSFRRIDKFLNSNELVKYVTRNEELEAIAIEGGTLSWCEGEDDKIEQSPTLQDIDLHVKPKSFVAVVGQVASGKSSLLASILGEMHRITGRFNVCKSMAMAYVPQQAWIQNMTVRDNILFGSPYNAERYKQILSDCCLEADLEILPGGDQAEIGEKGINMSGGQKQRVSLARACYSDSDIFLLDDPLSALDSHVAKHVFDRVLSSNTGLLRNKTRVLATNSLFVLPHVDHIIVLDNGHLVESGTYQELMSNKNGDSYLAEIMRQYSMTQSDQQVEKLEEPKHKPIGLSHIKPLKSDAKRMEEGKLTDIEKVELGSVDYEIYMKYFEAVSIWFLIGVVISLLLSSAFQVSTNFWLSDWSSDSEDPEKATDTSLRTFRLLIYGLFGFLQCLMVFAGSIILSLGAIRAARLLHLNLLERVLHSPMTFFDTTPIGRVVNRFAKDIDVIDSTLPGNFRSWMSCLLSVMSTLFVISYSFPSFLVIIVPLGLVYYLIQKIFIVTSRQLKRLESTTRSPIYSHFSETLSGISVIRAYDCADRFVDYSDNLVDRNQSCSYPTFIANRWLSVRLEFCGSLITLATGLFSAFSRGVISAGIAGLTISYSLNITKILAFWVAETSNLETNIVSVERIIEYMNNKQEDPWIKDKRPPDDWPSEGAINIEHFSARYRQDTDLVLRDLSISIKPCEKVGIVGRTGSGKSSLSLSLFRILDPSEGSIKIDELNLLDYGLHDVRSKLTIIPQDPVLFSGTLRFNLDPLDLYSDTEIWRALELAHLKPYISLLKLGLDYQVSEFGENFSVGQRQLVCLARAILRKSKILILDEATASVDLETDTIVQKTIRDIFSDCTIITIAHRLHTILDSDRILVLESGQVKELDSPENLIANSKSLFVSLARDAGIDTSSFPRQK